MQNGTICEYGKYEHATLHDWGKGQGFGDGYMAWYLTYVQDVHGNVVEYGYESRDKNPRLVSVVYGHVKDTRKGHYRNRALFSYKKLGNNWVSRKTQL